MYLAKTLILFVVLILAVGTVYADNWYKGVYIFIPYGAMVMPRRNWSHPGTREHGWDFICFTDHNVLLEGIPSKRSKKTANQPRTRLPRCRRNSVSPGWNKVNILAAAHAPETICITFCDFH